MAGILRRIEFAPRFKRDFKRARKHPDYDREDFLQFLNDLLSHEVLPRHYREHSLQKKAVNWAGFQEVHLGPDLVVIFKRLPDVIWLHRVGSHQDLFTT